MWRALSQEKRAVSAEGRHNCGLAGLDSPHGDVGTGAEVEQELYDIVRRRTCLCVAHSVFGGQALQATCVLWRRYNLTHLSSSLAGVEKLFCGVVRPDNDRFQ